MQDMRSVISYLWRKVCKTKSNENISAHSTVLCNHAIYLLTLKARHNPTTMWANAQRDGRPVEYRWRPLFNAAKFGWRPLLECRAVTLRGRETRWNLQGCPKLPNRSQPLAGRSTPYYEDMWRRYCCLTSFFFRLSIGAFVAKTQPNKVVRWCRDGDLLRPLFAASRVQHVSDLRPKFALWPHHVWKYGRHPISDRWD